MSIRVQQYYCGRIGVREIEVIAEKAAKKIVELRGAAAVCLTNDGAVTIESIEDVPASDLVGVFDKRPGLFQLWRLVEESLAQSVADRRIAGGYKQKHAVRNFRKAA